MLWSVMLLKPPDWPHFKICYLDDSGNLPLIAGSKHTRYSLNLIHPDLRGFLRPGNAVILAEDMQKLYVALTYRVIRVYTVSLHSLRLQKQQQRQLRMVPTVLVN